MKKMLISLDELLDTRLAMVGIFNPEIVEKWITTTSDDYFRRPSDDILWKSIGKTKEEWKRLWNMRNTGLLKQSIMTHIPNIITNVVLMYRDSQEHALGDLDVTLDVNVYPYELSENEKTVLLELLNEKMPIMKEIKLTWLSDNALTASYIKSNYDYVVMYNFNDWLNRNGKDLKPMLLTKIHFFVPRIFMTLPDESFIKELEKEKLLDMDVFKMTEAALAPKMGVTFVPPSDFGPVLTSPQKRRTQTKDLDSTDLSELYSPNTSLYDHL